MWPLNLSARDVLRLPGGTSIAWAVFDADWYRAAWPEETAHLAGAGATAVLEYYLATGQRLGHAPNPYFDEAWHRRTYPGIARLVEAGEFPSAFDAWCRGGCLERSPHWLFDEAHYRRTFPDLTDAFLRRQGLANGYDHYLWRGDIDGRSGHPLFDPLFYLSNLSPEDAARAAADGPFRDYLRRSGQSEPRTTILFDPDWYRARYPEASRSGGFMLHHYLDNATPAKFDPLPVFSEDWYLTRHDDVAARVTHGESRNGYADFLRFGIASLRPPSEHLDLAWYAARENVRADIASGRAVDPFRHFLMTGQAAKLPAVPPSDAAITETQARTLFRNRARALSVLAARTKLRFETTGTPDLSVIMILHNQFELTMMALASLRANFPGNIELILIDSGSNDETRDIQKYVSGAVYFAFDTNIGYLRGCNAALQCATAGSVLYLNNDIELAPNAVSAALARLHSAPNIGAVGGLILRTHGLVQEAGNIIYRDGSTQGYGRDLPPWAPEVNFTRDVEFCSGVFLMARRDVLNSLEGFDEAFAPAYFEDADLGVRMRAAGYRVVFDPSVVVHHLEYGSATSNRAAEAEISQRRRLFAERHPAYIADRPLRDERLIVFSRLGNPRAKRVLFIEDTVPLRAIGSGFVRSNDILRAMADIGYAVTVYPINGCPFDVASVYADMPDGVEVMHTCSAEQFAALIADRHDYYDAVWIGRTHNLATVRAVLEPWIPESGHQPAVILDTEALVSLRTAGQSAQRGETFDRESALLRELQDAPFCQTVIAVSDGEAEVMRNLGLENVRVIGHVRQIRPTPRAFEDRAGMLFVGAIHRMDSPNYDSLCWFIEEVLPFIERELTWQTRLTVAGFLGPDVNLERFQGHPRVTLCGPVTDLVPLYNSSRVFIAPTRFAAGTPYKIHESCSFGLPVVATTLLRRQLGWEDGRELLSADANDPEGFARQAVAAQRDAALWRGLREAALARLARENNPDQYRAEIADILGAPDLDRG